MIAPESERYERDCCKRRRIYDNTKLVRKQKRYTSQPHLHDSAPCHRLRQGLCVICKRDLLISYSSSVRLTRTSFLYTAVRNGLEGHLYETTKEPTSSDYHPSIWSAIPVFAIAFLFRSFPSRCGLLGIGDVIRHFSEATLKLQYSHLLTHHKIPEKTRFISFFSFGLYGSII